MTNPDNTVGTNAGYDGRTTPNAFNDILGAFTRGLVSGWACTPKSGMTVKLGGDGSTRDVAIAEDNAGNKTTINNRTATPVEITLAGAPATGNRIDSIVAYVDSAQSGQGATDVDFPSITGIIAVSGTAAGTPTAPTEAQIRSAITNDGADGAGAFYVVLANITVGQGVTTIGSGVITQGDVVRSYAMVDTDSIADGAVTSDKVDWTTLDKQSYQTSSYTSVANTSYADFGSVRVANAGTYLVLANAVFSSATATLHEVWLACRTGSTVISQSGLYGNQQGLITGLCSLSCSGIVTLSANDTVAISARVSTASSQIGPRTLTVIQIS